MSYVRTLFIASALLLALSDPAASSAPAAEPDLRIGREGSAVRLDLAGDSNSEVILESRAELATGDQWAPLLKLRGNPAGQRWYDPLCGTPQTRFYRLQQKLREPVPAVANLRMLDADGRSHELYYQTDVRAVILILAGDDLARLQPHQPTLARLTARISPPAARFHIVHTPPVFDRPNVRTQAAQLGLPIPVLEDHSRAVTRTLSTGYAPEAVVINTADWSIVYQGRIEDAIATGAQTITQSYLADALDAFLAEQPPAITQVATGEETPGLPPIKTPEYSTDIAPILQAHCVRCHSPGNIAPWSMTNYTVVQTFAPLIKSSVLAGQMPPWHSDPHIGRFANTMRLTPEQIDLLVHWIDQGSPRGNGSDPLEAQPLPPPPDWPLGQPTAIVSIAPQSVPATGRIEYQYLVAQNPFDTDVWLTAAVVKPGNRAVVHHCLVFTGSVLDVLNLRGGLGGFFAGYVPGMDQVAFPEGTGKRLRRTDLIVFQMHYTASGKPETDVTQLGLYASTQPPPRELVTGAAANTSIRIPPNTRDYPRQATKLFAKESLLYEFSPHMHYRGYSARFSLLLPDGTREDLLSVPAYYFDWQALYRLAEPKRVPAGSTLVMDGTFDNSTLNRFNPDPAQTVTFGEQTWDEMFIGYVNYAEVQ